MNAKGKCQKYRALFQRPLISNFFAVHIVPIPKETMTSLVQSMKFNANLISASATNAWGSSEKSVYATPSATVSVENNKAFSTDLAATLPRLSM